MTNLILKYILFSFFPIEENADLITACCRKNIYGNKLTNWTRYEHGNYFKSYFCKVCHMPRSNFSSTLVAEANNIYCEISQELQWP